MPFLQPNYTKMCYRDLTPEFLAENGIEVLILDIDNTLVTYDDPEPTPSVLAWMKEMNDAGISIAFVSNNDEERVARFNKDFGFPAYAKSGKPFGKNLRRAMEEMGTDITTTAVLGDQLLTDALAGKLLGLPVLIVPPIADKKTLFFRFKRWLEKPYMNEYKRRHMFP